ncbi:MAG TPA: Spy/CpxP family protein refolding chaperone [Caulobacteraceae bacterium]|nr:Spy/CpxP family protein refolding chaperone [Caulobacteraceae bacterium]
MTFSLKTLATAVCTAALASGALTSGAMAQDRPPPAGQNRLGQHWAEHRQERQAARMKALHDVLNIRADQEPAFQAFTVAMTLPHDGKDHVRPQPGQAPAPLTTPERLDREVARANERDQRLQTRVQAVKAFYAVLSPEQRKAFDALDMLRADRHGRFGGHRA